MIPSIRLVARRLKHCSRGATAIIFALCALPTIGLVGLGIDYFVAMANKTRLDAAADAAAIAAISTAKQYINSYGSSQTDPTLTNNALDAGKAQAFKVFAANASASLTQAAATSAVNVGRSGQTISATVTYTGAVRTAFGGLFAIPRISVGGIASSSLTMGLYLDFYLALDVSGSMGLPTSTAGQQQLMAINPDNRSNYPNGCQFACHFPGNQGYSVARQNNIPLRVDSVGNAVNNLIHTATATATLTNQYRIGVYPFINKLMQAAALSSSYANASSVAAALGDTYLDSGLSNAATQSMGSGGTHFENVLPAISNYVAVLGDGSSSARPKPFVFLVTDGADNTDTYNGSSWGGNGVKVPDIASACQSMKQNGIVISILYIPYQPIYDPDPSFAGDEDDKVNAIIPSLPGNLKNCASSGFFFTANTATDITNAMQAMFFQALQAARLTR